MEDSIESLETIEMELAQIKRMLQKTALLERMGKERKIGKETELENVDESFRKGEIERGVYNTLLKEIQAKNLDSKRKISTESIKVFTEMYNSFGRVKREMQLGAKTISLAEGKMRTEAALEKEAATESIEIPPAEGGLPPVTGGMSPLKRMKSLFIIEEAKPRGKTGKPLSAKKKRELPVPLKKIIKKASSIKAIKPLTERFIKKGTASVETVREAFNVPAFATDSGLVERITSSEYEITQAKEEKAGRLSALKEDLFAEGKTADAQMKKEEGLISLIPGYAYGKVLKDKKGQKTYYVIEPDITAEDKKTVEMIKNELVNVLTIEELSREKMFAEVDEIITKKKLSITNQQRHKLMYFLSRDLLGLDRIEPLMHDPLIEDIECDGVDIPVYVIHQKEGHLPSNISFKLKEELEDFIIKMAQLSKTYVSYASPLVDSILPDGSRVNAVLTSSVSTKGPSFTIRLFPDKPRSPADLIANGTVTPKMFAYLWTVLEFKKSILITGPTASGKTTILNSLAMFIPYANRVVSIEDTRELNITHENWLPQVARPGFGPPDATGKRFGEIDMVQLIKESFRQRPDYLVVGEVRGKETFILFQGMASGHCALATFHARSVDDVVSRLTTPPINLYPSLLESVDIIINLGFAGEEEIKRRLRTVAEIKRYNAREQRLDYNNLLDIGHEQIKTKHKGLRLDELGSEYYPLTQRSILLKQISLEYNIPLPKLEERINKRAKFLEKLATEGVKDYKEFADKMGEFKNAERKSG